MKTEIEDLPSREKISTAACLGKRVCRPDCPCCGGSAGIRRGFRKLNTQKAKTLRDHRK